MNLIAGALLREGATAQQLSVALQRCQRITFPVRLPHILNALPGHGIDDGRPEAETAWAMCPKSEEASVVWTEEMAAAFDVARQLLFDGDSIGARMAFKEAYAGEVARAREQRRPIHWTASLGWDKTDRLRALTEAVTKKRLSREQALELAGAQQQEMQLALAPANLPLLAGEVKPEIRLEIPGLPGVLKVLADSHAMPAEIKLPAKLPRKRSREEQLAHLASLPISEEAKKKLAETISANPNAGRTDSRQA